MNILLSIQTKLSSLSTNERKVGQYVLANPEEIILLSTQKIAEKSGVSPATVIRFVKSIGLDGVPQLKQELSVWKSSSQSNQDFQELVANEDVDSIKNKLKTRINHMVELVNFHLSDEAIAKTAQLIADTQLIYIFGIGASYLVAQDLAQKLNRSGKTAICGDNIHAAAVLLTNNHQKKLFIGVSDRGESVEVIDITELARKMGITTVAITGKADSTLAATANYALVSVSGENFEFRQAATVSMLAQMYLVDILYYTYVSKNYEATHEAVLNSLKVIKKIEKR